MKKASTALGIATIAAATVLAAAAPASALKPVRVPVGPGSYEFPGVCDFPISYEETSAGGTLTFYADGHMSAIGKYTVHITNLDDPSRSMDIQATGPQWFYPDGTNKLGGHTLFVLAGGVDFTSGLYLATGSWTFTRNDSGGIATVSGTGGLGDDLCAQIA